MARQNESRSARNAVSGGVKTKQRHTEIVEVIVERVFTAWGHWLVYETSGV
jgi:hypothetical protein